MKIDLIHYTPHYHKLVEVVARNAYQSWHKLSPDSHKFVKSIMKKGHLSIASVGNIVIGINSDSIEEYNNILTNLMIFKEINNFVRWTTYHDENKNTNYHIVLSMNLLTWLEILNEYDKYHKHEYSLKNNIKKLLDDVNEIKWFYDDTVELEPMENPYTAKTPTLLNPVILAEDYNNLKYTNKLTDYEMDIHTTITLSFITDRASGLQTWRHKDMVGGVELSQRYVDRSSAEFRYPSDLFSSNDAYTQQMYKNFMRDHIETYTVMKDNLIKSEYGQKRGKEIGRNLLPNITTHIIQSRPLKQWKHFFNLRDSVHAQLEIQEDTRAFKKAFEEVNIIF